MRYTLKHFQLGEEDNDYGIISSYRGGLVSTLLDEAHDWFEVRDGIKYHVKTRSTINSEKSITVEVAIPEQHPLFNNNLIIQMCGNNPYPHSVTYRPGVVADILDLIADTFYNAGVPYEYEAYAKE
jgi:hypothetical protein